MLARLYIRNFALIESLEMDLGQGLNILTGETGAGKSLLLGAIGLILGRRVDYSYIFNPEEKCIVEAEFQKIPVRTRQALAGYEDFDLEGDHIVLRREASANGKSRAFVNDTPVSLNVLKEVTSMLVDLHGQHENQRLLDAEQQLFLLDQYAGSVEKVKEFAKMHQACLSLTKEIEALEQEEREAKQQQDYIAFQLEELKGLTLTAESESELESELSLLQHAEEIREALTTAVDLIYDGEPSAYSVLSDASAKLQHAAKLNQPIRAQVERLEEMLDSLADISRTFNRMASNMDLDPAALAQLQAQFDTLNRLKIKHGKRSAADLGALREELSQKAGRFSSLGDRITDAQDLLATQWEALAKQGLEIETLRKAAIPQINQNVDALLHEVGLEHAEFSVELTRMQATDGPLRLESQRLKPGPAGFNQVEFKIRTNKGMPMGSLNQTASGGEVSRVMLAIKAAMAAKAELSVLIFDEIDTGISGATANKVGKVMQKLSQHYQVIAITHLPQIAGKGSHHFRIFKEIKGGKTLSNVVKLAQDDRILEIARMLSGEDPSPSAIKNAKELLSSN